MYTMTPDQDFVIESVPEDLALKQRVFQELDGLASPGTLLASNTTALSVTAIARDCSRPERVLSAHYYLPAHLIPLVDVIPGEKTSPDAIEATRLLLEEVGKAPVVFGSGKDVRDDVFAPDLAYSLTEACLRKVSGAFHATGAAMRVSHNSTRSWSPPPAPPVVLAEDEVHVWRASLRPPPHS